jgi:hypothetical protein
MKMNICSFLSLGVGSVVPDRFIIAAYKYTSITERDIRSPANSLSLNQDPQGSRIIGLKIIQVST